MNNRRGGPEISNTDKSAINLYFEFVGLKQLAESMGLSSELLFKFPANLIQRLMIINSARDEFILRKIEQESKE
ncbi:hypothetical protein KAR91_20115 [Candidatus Pacearchaeota archaeon]|nr:hypothetical protein [Candidatus Pacearchaeota archaeon]